MAVRKQMNLACTSKKQFDLVCYTQIKHQDLTNNGTLMVSLTGVNFEVYAKTKGDSQVATLHTQVEYFNYLPFFHFIIHKSTYDYICLCL